MLLKTELFLCLEDLRGVLLKIEVFLDVCRSLEVCC